MCVLIWHNTETCDMKYAIFQQIFNICTRCVMFCTVLVYNILQSHWISWKVYVQNVIFFAFEKHFEAICNVSQMIPSFREWSI